MIQFFILALTGIVGFADCCYPKLDIKNRLNVDIRGTAYFSNCDDYKFKYLKPGANTYHDRGACLLILIRAYKDSAQCKSYESVGTSYAKFDVVECKNCKNGCKVKRRDSNFDCTADSDFTIKGRAAMSACAEQCDIQKTGRFWDRGSQDICPTASVLMEKVRERQACENCILKAIGWNSATMYQIDVKTLPKEISDDLELDEIHKCASKYALRFRGHRCVRTYNETEQGALAQMLTAIGRTFCFNAIFQKSCKNHASRILVERVSGSDEEEFN